MKKEEIKTELIKRGQKISDDIRRNVPKSSGMLAQIKNVAERIKTTDNFAKEITKTLNSILRENDVTFRDNEKQELITFLKPTIAELIKRHIRN